MNAPARRAAPARIPALAPIAARPVMPESADFYRTATAEEWEARMREKYGAGFDQQEAE